ncbi:hypothetical protein [Duganella aquatilis]|nr:hypothetical protein [Duganella aquatilis]
MNLSDVEMVARLVERIEKIGEAAAVKAALAGQPMTWVKLERYVEIAGDSVDAVQARRKAGKWLNGRECKVVDGRVWINLRAVEQWIEKWE